MTARVLIVDDDPVNARLLSFVLHRIGMTVSAVPGGREALDRLAADPAGCDLIFLDIMMPDVDGFAVLSEMAARGSTVPVVVLTASAAEDVAHRIAATRYPIAALLTKPLHRETVQSAALSALVPP